MQPSEIIRKQQIEACKETIKTGTPEEKKAAKARLNELTGNLRLEAATISTDEQQ